MRHHPIIGYEYIPGIRQIRPRPDGGKFELAVNAAGIRSSREYSFEKPPGVYRILVFGDSQADGLFQSNEQRFTERIERRNPGLEVINFSVPGTGTDQQLLLFEQVASKYEFDAVLLVSFLINIRRNCSWTLQSLQPNTGRIIVRSKPRFVLVMRDDGTSVLELRNVPIPKPEEPEDCSIEPKRGAGRFVAGVRKFKRHATPTRLAKRFLYPLLGWLHLDPFPILHRVGYDAFPEYESPDTDEWKLMAAILERFAQGCGPKPFVIAPLVNSSYMQFSVGRGYWERFHSLDDGARIHVIDLLPYFLKLGKRASACFFEPIDSHLSDFGHQILADAVESELRRLKLHPRLNCTPMVEDGLPQPGAK